MSTTFAADFYVTCATVIPVLFLSAAVQAGSYETIYDSIVKAWRKTGQAAGPPITVRASHVGLDTLAKALETLQDAHETGQAVTHEAHQATLEVPPTTRATEPAKRWRRLRIAAAMVAYPFFPLIASAVVLSGALGEAEAIYALYKGSEQPEQRQLVFGATLILIVPVAARPFVTYMWLTFSRIICAQAQYFSMLKCFSP